VCKKFNIFMAHVPKIRPAKDTGIVIKKFQTDAHPMEFDVPDEIAYEFLEQRGEIRRQGASHPSYAMIQGRPRLSRPAGAFIEVCSIACQSAASLETYILRQSERNHRSQKRSQTGRERSLTLDSKSGLYRQCAGAGEVRERGNAGAPVHCRYGLS
jgi:hypothetical protein